MSIREPFFQSVGFSFWSRRLFCVCPLGKRIAGSAFHVDHTQALGLSRCFVEASLEHRNATLVNADGKPIELPSVLAAGP